MNQSLTRTGVCNILALAAILSFSLMATGCSTMTSLTNKELPVDTSAVSANGSYSVEMHPNFGGPKQYKGQLTGTTTVSEALAESGAVKKFRSMDVEILRVVEHKGKKRGLRMPVKYERDLRGPASNQDYALLDGDRIVVKPLSGGSLMKMVGAIAGGAN